MLDIGMPAPAFSLESTLGGKLSLQDLRGRFAVIVFYPADNTPG